jgi:hypothetical protein
MPLAATDYFQRTSDFVPFIIEDSDLKGGYRVFDTLTDRDEWTAFARDIFGFIEEFDPRKEGQLVYVIETGIIYKLDSDKETWVELELGGGAAEFDIEQPLEFVGDRLTINSSRILPPGGNPGQVVGLDENGNPVWLDVVSNPGTRSIVEYQMDEQLLPGNKHDFALPDLGRSILMVRLEVNAAGLRVEGWTSIARDDRNPFTFISNNTLLVDEGIKVADDLTERKFRRYSFMSNQDDPINGTQYFTFTNETDGPITPRMSLTYVVLE